MSRAIVAYLTIRGPLRLGSLAADEADPTPAQLADFAEPLTARNGGVAPPVVVRTTPWRASHRVLVATFWNGSQVVRRLGIDEPDPSPAALAAAARLSVRDGVAPVVRVMEAAPSLRSSGVGASGRPAGLSR